MSCYALDTWQGLWAMIALLAHHRLYNIIAYSLEHYCLLYVYRLIYREGKGGHSGIVCCGMCICWYTKKGKGGSLALSARQVYKGTHIMHTKHIGTMWYPCTLGPLCTLSTLKNKRDPMHTKHKMRTKSTHWVLNEQDKINVLQTSRKRFCHCIVCIQLLYVLYFI